MEKSIKNKGYRIYDNSKKEVYKELNYIYKILLSYKFILKFLKIEDSNRELFAMGYELGYLEGQKK